MGTFGRIAIGARGQIAYKEEAAWGYALPPLSRVEFKTESFANEIGNLQSEAINPSRGITKHVNGTSNVGGDIAIEQNTEGYEVWYKHALGDAITLWRTDGGIRTRLTQDESLGATTLNVEDTTGFDAGTGTDLDLVVVYRDANGALATEWLVYSAKAAQTFTVTATTVALHQGAWVFQAANVSNTWWDGVYTHFIEAGRTLPAGSTFEVGRDVAFFTYSGCKVNTHESTFTAQEILQATFAFIGKGEYSGGDVATQITAGQTSLIVKNYTLSGPSSKTISASTYWNSGGAGVTHTLQTCVTSGTYTGDDDKMYILEIDEENTPDTFKWSNDGGATWTAAVAVTGAAQLLELGVSVAFAATTGHILGDRWYFSATVPQAIGFNPNGGTIQIGDENDITYTAISSYSPLTLTLPATGAGATTVTHAVDEPVVPQVSWGELNDPPATDILSSFQSAVYMDSSAQEVLNGSFTLNNNLYTDKFQLGDKFRAGLPEQQRSVEGLIHVEFDDLILYHKFINGTEAYLEFRCVDESETIGDNGSDTTNDVYRQAHYILPRIKFTGTTPQIGGPEIIEHDMNFVALQDPTNNHNELIAIFVNTINHMF